MDSSPQQKKVLSDLISRYFHFTIFEWEDADLPIHLPKEFSYVVWGQEVCPTTQRKHLQCYAIAKGKTMRGTAIQKLFPTARNIAKQYFKGSISESINYCKKEKLFTEFGVIPPDQAQGKRSDLDGLCEMIVEGANNRELIAVDPATYLRNYKGIEMMRETLYEPKYRPDLKVIYKYGQTGLGKTYDTRRVEYPKCFKKPIGKGLWFDKYSHEREVLIDEFRGQWPLSDVLQILDSDWCQVEVKGGHVTFDPDVIILCSNDHPSTMYMDHSVDSRKAFFRRLTEIHVYYGRNKYHVLSIEQRKKWMSDSSYTPDQPVITIQQQLIPTQLVIPNMSRKSAIEHGLKCGGCGEWHFECYCHLK